MIVCDFFWVKKETETASLKHYMDNPDLPLYFQVASPYNCSQLIGILMNNSLSSDKVCGSRPLGVNDNATFVIDLDRVWFDDLKADDFGSWRLKYTIFCLDNGSHIYYNHARKCMWQGILYPPVSLLCVWDMLNLSPTDYYYQRWVIVTGDELFCQLHMGN